MGQKNTEKCLSTGKEREDREVQSKHKFDPLRLEVKYPGTAIHLLQCQEKPVLLAAAAALAKFGAKSKENLETLFDLEIMKSVIPLIEHDDLFTRRFAAKLLAEMTAIPNVRNFLLDSDYYISYFTKVLVNEKDTFMQEFSSLILVEISKDMYGTAQLLAQCPSMDFLFERIKSPDPDVKKNNIEIIFNLLQDPTGAKEILDAKTFNLTSLYELFGSQYPEIQRLALNVIRDFVSRNKDEHLQDLFRKTRGLEALLNFLDNEEWHDLHAEALKILCLSCDNPTTVELFDNVGGVRKVLMYMEDALNSKLFLEAFDVVIRLSGTPVGRKSLHSYGIVDYLLRTLRGTVQPDIYKISCHGIGMMALHSPAAEVLTAENCTKDVLEILKNENLKWPVRQAAIFALNELLKCDVQNCKNFSNIQGQYYLSWLVKQSPGKVPVEVQKAAVDGLTTIAKYPPLRRSVINAETIDALCISFESRCPSMDELKIACCIALSVICVDKAGRDAFLRAHGPKRLYNLLCDVHSIPIRNAAVQLVQLLCADVTLANAFVAARYLVYMLNNRSSARVIPSWDTCIEALFNSHLPIKFAFTGRLSLHDVTQDGFYVLRRTVCPFPVLDEVFHFKICPMESVYVVNCSQPGSTDTRDGIQNETFVEGESVNEWLNLKFGGLQCDPCLREYIELFKSKLHANEPNETTMMNMERKLVNVRYVVLRAKLLAEFVARQMSGPDPETKCINHQLEVHLKQIRDSIETTVIPLGMLRIGSYLERALLFKVIADRICLPCALVRGEYGKAWIELAIPQVHHPEEDTSLTTYTDGNELCPEFTMKKKERNRSKNDVDHENRRSMIFPKSLLRPNFIVDLMNVPGDLIPIGSKRAKAYCDNRLVYDTACCDS